MSNNFEYPEISALRIDMYDIEKPARDFIAPIEPQNAIARAWIPQSLGDQIWVMWKFKTQQEREQFEAGLPSEVARWIDRGVIKFAIGFGWHTRDFNGFY